MTGAARLRQLFWKTFYGRWRTSAGEAVPGVSLLLPVPADLPVFTTLALDVLGKQRGDDFVEALLIPDLPSPRFRAFYERERGRFTRAPLRLVELRPLDRLLARTLGNGHNNHFLQLLRGVEQARGSHVLLHDADAFLEDPGFIARLHRECCSGDRVAFGVAEAWDEWLRERGLGHVTATWELLMRRDWLRSFPPCLHRGHEDEFGGERHAFDTTLLPQALTPPGRIGHLGLDRAQGFVHFNFVIVTYRRFQKAAQAGTPFEDEHFRLLLVRMLTDAFGPEPSPGALPSAAELERGLRDGDAPVTYRGSQRPAHFAEFREKLERLLTGPLLDAGPVGVMREAVAPFDAHYGWRA